MTSHGFINGTFTSALMVARRSLPRRDRSSHLEGSKRSPAQRGYLVGLQAPKVALSGCGIQRFRFHLTKLANVQEADNIGFGMAAPGQLHGPLHQCPSTTCADLFR